MSDEKLHEYFDGELPQEERTRFERAMAADPDLARRLGDLRELDDALGTVPGHAAPLDFTARVVRAAHRRPFRILRFAAPLAAAAAIVLAVLLMRSQEPPVDQEEVAAYIWESDVETYGSLALTDLEDQILEEMEGA